MSSGGSIAARVAIATAVVLASAAAIVFAATRDDDGAPAERATGSWGALSPSPYRRTEVGAARIGDRIYVVGGFASGGGTTGEDGSLRHLRGRWAEVAPLPIAVNHPGVTALRAASMYTEATSAVPRSRVASIAISPERDRWTRLADAPIERGAVGLVGIGPKLYAAGGYSQTDQTVTELAI